MKKNSKIKIVIRFFFIVLVFTSCSLDIPIEDEITGMDAIDNVAIANETLSGIYKAYPKDRITFSKLSDDFYPNHTIDDNISEYQFYKWNANELIFLSDNLWNSYYNTNTKANVLLSRIPKINTNTQQEKEELNYIKAQTLCLKAFAYFELVLLYSDVYNQSTKNNFGIILKDMVSSEELPRSSLEESYQEIENLLLKAIKLFKDSSKTNYRFSKNSAKALLAKVYFNWKKYEKSIALCDELIRKINLKEGDFLNVWKSPKNNTEALLVFENNVSYFSSIYDSEQGKDQYYINFNIIYQTTDIRKKASFITEDFFLLDNTKIQANFLKKYRNKIDDIEVHPLIIFRTAELYFIKSESLYHLSRETQAKATINSLLKIRKDTPLISSGTSFLNDLLKEKQKEFLGEGIRYFDLKRNKLQLERVNEKRNQVIITIQANDYRWVLPIPKVELNENTNIKNQQNPNW